MTLIQFGWDENYGDNFCEDMGQVASLEEAKVRVKSYILDEWEGDVEYREDRWNGNEYSIDDDDVLIEDNWSGWTKFKVIEGTLI